MGTQKKQNQLGQLGMIGGGQLALMLAQAAIRLGKGPIVFTSSESDPVTRICRDVILGEMTDFQALRRFFSQVDIVLFENEFVNCAVLREAALGTKVRFFPPLEAIEKFQDKLNQKRVLTALEIPTSPYTVLSSQKDLEPQLQEALKQFGGTGVIKWSRGGYDGKGVFILNGLADHLAEAKHFCSLGWQKGGDLYVEQKIAFKRELAMIATYSWKHEIKSYPLVISEQNRGICSLVYGPAISCGLTPELDHMARGYAQKLAELASLYGTFGVEFFETLEGDLLVNEIAPRVHNSGHYTQDASDTDQFENHIRAAFGLPLGSTDSKAGFAMLNVLGPPDHFSTQEDSRELPVPSSRGHLHWYGKSTWQPYRKLGHLNGIVNDANEIEGLIQELRKSYEDWERGLKK